jgi:hypothetical protein
MRLQKESEKRERREPKTTLAPHLPSKALHPNIHGSIKLYHLKKSGEASRGKLVN